MNPQKRTLSPKSNHGDNLYEIGSSCSKPKSKNYDFNILENDNSVPCFPLISQTENTQLLPKYSAVLSRTVDEGVGMEDLDQLQQDLEKLLASCVVRSRLLNCEIESLDKVEEKRDKKGKLFDKSPFKRKRIDEKLKSRETKNGVRIVKRKHYSLPVNNSVIVPRNICDETSDKFWLSVEQYCTDVSKDDVAYLDELVQECSQEVDVKIPDVGDHYMSKWSDDSGYEQSLTNGKLTHNDVRKNGMTSAVDIFSDPLTQRSVNMLIEEKIMPKLPDNNADKLKFSPRNILKSPSGAYPNICMELVDQGILDIDDVSKHLSQEDEILQEIKKCQQELAIVNEHNVEELNRLRDIVAKDQKRQEVKGALDKVDKQVMEMYNRLLIAEQKQIQQEDALIMKQKQCLQVYEANSVIKQQASLNEIYTVLTEQTDYSSHMQ